MQQSALAAPASADRRRRGRQGRPQRPKSSQFKARLSQRASPFRPRLFCATPTSSSVSILPSARCSNRWSRSIIRSGSRGSWARRWIASRGNFICVDFGRDAAPINSGLLQRGVIVRPVAGYGMPNFLRISIGLPGENQRFLDALAEVLRG